MVQPEIDCFELSNLGEALGTLAARLTEGGTEVKKATSVLVNRMAQSETADNELPRLGYVLGSLAAQLPEGDEEVKKAAAILHERLASPQLNDEQLSSFAWSLGRVVESGRLDSSQADAFARTLAPLMQLRPDADRITAWCQLERCTAQADKQGLEPRVQAYLEILKHPQCIREGRKALLQGLEKVVKEDFTPEGTEEPDVWAVVEWVKGRNAKGWKLNLRRAGD